MTLVIDTKVCKCSYCGSLALLDVTLTPGFIHSKDCPGELIEIGYLLKKDEFDESMRTYHDNNVKRQS